MKAEFFVVAFCFLLAGVFFTYAKRTGWGNPNESSISIRNDNFREEIKYSGKIRFSDDERTIGSITPGGFLDFTRNEEQLVAKSDKQGVIHYTWTLDGITQPMLDSNGKQFMAEAVKEMIAMGIDASERMDRIYQRSGNQGLLNALSDLKNDDVKRMYVDKILSSGSLSTDDLVQLSKIVSKSMGSDEDKRQVLQAFKMEQLSDSMVAKSYLQAVQSLGDDNAKATTLKYMLKANLPVGLFPQLVDVTNGIRDENERVNVLQAIIRKDQLDENRASLLFGSIDNLNDDNQRKNLLVQLIQIKGFALTNWDKLLESSSLLRDETQKDNLLVQLMQEDSLGNSQWIALIAQVNTLGNNDFDKGNLLLRLAGKMPKNDQTRTAFLLAAKTIRDDSEYGKVMRAFEP